MNIDTVKIENGVVVHVEGKVDADTAPKLEDCFSNQMAQDETKFIVNFEALDYISSAGLRVVMATAKKVMARQGVMMFVGLKGTVEKVFKLSGFSSVFKIFESNEEAMKHL